MVSIDATILIQLANFLILTFILNKIFFQPILKIQKERQDTLSSSNQSVLQKHAELKQMREDYHRKLDQARQEAYDLVSAHISEANQQRESRLQQVQQEIDARLSEAKEELASKESSLRDALGGEVGPLAELIFTQLTQPSRKEVSIS